MNPIQILTLKYIHFSFNLILSRNEKVQYLIHVSLISDISENINNFLSICEIIGTMVRRAYVHVDM